MIRRSVLGNAPARTRVNVTPMIDVVMCLIVFYLMVGQLALNRASGVQIPTTTDGIPPTDAIGDPVIIGVRADGAVLLNGEPITLDRLPGELGGRLTRSPDARFEIRADRDAPFGVVRPVLNAARSAGITEVDMVTERGS